MMKVRKRSITIGLAMWLAFTSLWLYAAGEADIMFQSPRRDRIWIGSRQIKVRLIGIEDKDIKSVEFYLDGKLIKELTAPPYAFNYDFGPEPKNRRLRVLVRGIDKVIKAKEIHSFQIDDFQAVEVSEVVIPVVVTDRRGNYIGDLKKEDFILQVDGRGRDISYFAHGGKTKFHMVLLIDISFSMRDKIAQVKEAANMFLKELLTPQNRAMVVFFNDEVFEDTDFTSRVSDLEDSLSVAIPFGATALHDAVMYCMKLLRGISGHNIVVLFSDGEDNSSYVDPYTLVKKVEKSNVVIYSIGRKRRSDTPDDYQLLLERISTSSGGQTFMMESARDIQEIYQRIRRDIQAQYVLQVSLGGQQKLDRFHPLTVKLKKHRGYQIRTIKGFYY
jgi:VWFA-related protein